MKKEINAKIRNLMKEKNKDYKIDRSEIIDIRKAVNDVNKRWKLSNALKY